MKSPPKMPQMAMVRIWVASLHQKDQRRKYAGFLFYPASQVSLSRVDSNSCGDVAEDVAEDGAKTALCNSDDRCQRQKQGGAVGAAASRMRVPPKAQRSRWEPRPGFLFILRGSRNPPAPTKKPQRIMLHSPFPVSSLPQGRLALQGNKKDALRSLAKRLCL